MSSCKCCGKYNEGHGQWCPKTKKCQEHKKRHQRESKANKHKQYTSTRIKKGKLNGRFCQHEGCGKPLRGWFFFNCDEHYKMVDDYTLRTNVCM